jgi:SnoaL-like domain
MMLSHEDHLAIQQLYARYYHAFDLGDPERWAACFTPNGSLRADHIGREQIAALARRIGETRSKGRRWISSLVLDSVAEGSATGTCPITRTSSPRRWRHWRIGWQPASSRHAKPCSTVCKAPRRRSGRSSKAQTSASCWCRWAPSLGRGRVIRLGTHHPPRARRSSRGGADCSVPCTGWSASSPLPDRLETADSFPADRLHGVSPFRRHPQQFPGRGCTHHLDGAPASGKAGGRRSGGQL